MQSELDKIYEEEYEERLKEGIEEGVKEGIAEEIVKIALNLKSKGFPIEAISECTGLSISAVQAI